MAHTKTVSPYGWNFSEEIAYRVKVAHGKLIGVDRDQFIKRASGSHELFLPLLDKIKLANDEEYVHLIGLGAYEKWGFNRNGDGFKEAACRDFHDTFTKYAKFYRNHKNKDPNESYGIIKWSAYNPYMKRVELLVGLNKTKEAAERNHGFIADRELEKLARGESLAVSMACRVPDDVCSYCSNRARNRDEYCTSEKCAAGGCKDNLTKLVKVGSDVHHMGVFNERPIFFDMSDVFRPACRTAYGAKADYVKMASDMTDFGHGSKSAADLGIVAPLRVFEAQAAFVSSGRVVGQVKLAYALDDAHNVRAQLYAKEALRAFEDRGQASADLRALGLDSDDRQKVASVLAAFADARVILPLREFARMTKRAEQTPAAAASLRGVYGRMLADGTLEQRLERNPYAPAEAVTEFAREKAAAASAEYGLGPKEVSARATRSALRSPLDPPVLKTGFEKSASAPQAEELARDYAVYKLAALERIAGNDPEFTRTARMAVAQDSVA